MFCWVLPAFVYIVCGVRRSGSMPFAAVSDMKDYLEGTIQLDGVAYTIACRCSEAAEDSVTDILDLGQLKVCQPVVGTAHVEHKGSVSDGLTAQEVEDFYGQPRHLDFTSINSTGLNCSDDRNTQAAIATLGGEQGEYLLAMAVLESFMRDSLSQQETDALLKAWLSGPNSNRDFYACTDDTAVANLEKQLGIYTLNVVRIIH
eukprot:Gregarina_sp_Poly_1__10763@NODE_823_length_6130_cov_96_470229_g595_i0_p4_GENE_NODE_823_length_6130_cov_96_470229_g595_i0NODE_823_length_6130_cov_96_470229_g595_i0_p4_ORF_typecomplete_len203_score27_72zfGRF/PF06839_12/1_5e03zfGRF/PF06839_12/0_081_NODE_823_length_6130_cov_96_470229_g595_i013061914